MFPVTTTQQFDESIAFIFYRSYFAGAENPRQGLEASLNAVLINVCTFPEAYPRTGRIRRRFTFEYRSTPYTVLFTFDGQTVTLHDIHFSRSARTARWLE